jgi:hypothetical protein
MSVNTKEYLDETEAGFQSAIKEVELLVANLDTTTLNAPEAEGKWNMLECIEHMSLATEVYTKNISDKIKSGGLPPASKTFKGHWKGRMFARMNAPKPGGEIPMKLKTFKFMEPKNQLKETEVINRFISIHREIIDLIEQSRSVNIDKVKVATALGPMVKLRLGEAYRFILAHTQRHLVQLKRIKTTVTQ